MPRNGTFGGIRTPAACLHKAGFVGVRRHDCRHTMASLYLRTGINPKTVAERLGHSSVVITLDTSGHLMPDMQESAAAMFDEAIELAADFVRG